MNPATGGHRRPHSSEDRYRPVPNLMGAERRLAELQANLARRLRDLLNRLSPYDPLEREIADQVAELERSLHRKDAGRTREEAD